MKHSFMPGVQSVMSKQTRKLSEFLHKDERYKGTNVACSRMYCKMLWLEELSAHASQFFVTFCRCLQPVTAFWCAEKERSSHS